MVHIMESKEQEFIDHTLLAPEYIREANNFIIDLINFPKASSSPGGVINNADTLSSELHFSNGLFNDTSEHVNHNSNTATSINEQQKSPRDMCMAINDANFLSSVTNKCASPTATAIETAEYKFRLNKSQQVKLTTTAKNDRIPTDKQCDVIGSNCRKVLPHKKRIARKLKIVNGDKNINLDLDNVTFERQERKLSYVDLFLMSSRMRYRCELCDHGSKTQLEFYVHLKQHYEPSTPETILAAMKTTLDALGPERIDNSNNDLYSINRKTIADANGMAQILHDVQFPFENLPQSSQAIEQSMPYPIKIDYANNANNQNQNQNQNQNENHLSASSISLTPTSSGTLQSLDDGEFSEAEDMLEGIRDKVFIEDTHDTMDLITPNSPDLKPNWFNNSCFTGMELKVKSIGDALFNGTFQPLQLLQPVNDAHNPTASTTNVDVDVDVDDKVTKAVVSTLHTNLATTSIKNHDNDQDNVQLTDIEILAVEAASASASLSSLSSSSSSSSSSLMLPLKMAQTQTENYRSKQRDTKRKRKNFQRKRKENHVIHESIEDLKDNKQLIMWSTQSDAGILIDGDHKKFVCKKCLRIFNSSNAFKYHNRTHSGIRPHKCDICEKKFYAQGALNAHMRMHTGVKPYKCEHCDKQFRQWGDLKYHTTSLHSMEKTYTCEFCGKSFSRKYSLVVHVRIHTSERNYKCEWCDKSFRASSYLQNHRKIHTGEKPYQCDICAKKFRVSTDLNRHKRMHERHKLKYIKNIE